MTSATLSARTAKDLAQMAKRRGVRGWHAMRKDQLVRALLRLARAKSAAAKNGKNGAMAKPVRRAPSPKTTSAAKTKATSKTDATLKGKLSRGNSATARRPKPRFKPTIDPRVARRIEQVKAKMDRARDLAAEVADSSQSGARRDRVVVMVRDPYWLHVYWELGRAGVERARAAMGQLWHTAKPVLRLLEVSSGSASKISERVVRDVEIHGGVNNWYIDVKDPPCTYQVDIGYLAPGGRFHSLGRSNVVTTPIAGSRAALDENWADVADHFEEIFALSGGYEESGDSSELRELFEERLRRPMGSPMTTRYGAGAAGLVRNGSEFEFGVDAELIIYGATQPDAHVSMRGEPVRLRPDGTFTVRLALPEKRQVIPVVASTRDGVEQRTIVLAIDRNTKIMEPVIRDPGT